MVDLIRRLVWFFVVACAIAYTIYLVMGSVVYSQAKQDNSVILVRDWLLPGEHHLFGMIMVASTCEQLSVRTEQVDKNVYHLRFETWKEPNIECVQEETARAFRTIVFAPATGVHFIGSLNDEPLQLAITPSLEKIH